jgi:hypothetical protein
MTHMTAVVWMIVLVMLSGARVELPRQYETEKECIAAAAALAQAHGGASASCVPVRVEQAQ